MATKLARKTALVFGSTPGANQIAQFGSLAAAAPAFSTDPAVIQSLAAWITGWYDAVLGGNSPTIEDLNAFSFVMAYQVAYLAQAGTAEWDSGTNYFIGSLVNMVGVTYCSLTDSNLNNNPQSSGANWTVSCQANIGDTSTGSGTLTLAADFLRCTNSGASNLTLPDCTTTPLGWIYTFKAVGTGNVNILPHTGQVIDTVYNTSTNILQITPAPAQQSIKLRNNLISWDII